MTPKSQLISANDEIRENQVSPALEDNLSFHLQDSYHWWAQASIHLTQEEMQELMNMYHRAEGREQDSMVSKSTEQRASKSTEQRGTSDYEVKPFNAKQKRHGRPCDCI